MRMGRKQTNPKQHKNGRSNQASILQMWGGSQLGNSVADPGKVQEKAAADIPCIEVDAPESEEEMLFNGVEDAIDVQSEGTRPPTSDEEGHSSPSSHCAALQNPNSRPIPKVQASTKLFPIFGRAKRDETVDLSSYTHSEQLGTTDQATPSTISSRATSSVKNNSKRSRRIERTRSTPSNPTMLERVIPLPLSQPLAGAGPDPIADKGKLVIDIDSISDESLKSGTRDEPISIDSSPIKVRPKETNRLANTFFAPRKQFSHITANRHRKKTEQSASWPGGNDQHVRGTQSTFQMTRLEFARAFFDPTQEELEFSLNFLKASPDRQCLSNLPPLSAYQPPLANAEAHGLPPSLSRFSSHITDVPRSRQETWNERWRPRCAAQVIGNEDRARYLRDWLRALEVQTVRQLAGRSTISDIASDECSKPKKDVREVKRPTVIRTVSKPRCKRGRYDSDEEDIEDWIADDDEDENPWRQSTPFFDDLEESPTTEGGSPWKPRMTRLKRRRAEESETADPIADAPILQSQEEPTYDFTAYLTNTILLCGPTGCGKTAAVYACAEELGWEVFEVYPGIGKRNGASLLSLVGDAGKHHLVGKGSTRTVQSQDTQKKGIITSIFSGKDSRTPPETDLASNAEHNSPPSNASLIALEQRLSSEVLRSISNRENKPTQMLNRQSIILLEEVDILFGEDVNFWPTVVTLIKESKRPVVMTCNDPNIIPFSELPLQTVLYFSPCPPDLAASYIRSLTLAEGHSFSPAECELIIRSQSSANGSNIINEVIDVDRQSHPEPVTDIRRAINYTQFLCQRVIRDNLLPQLGLDTGNADQASNDYASFFDRYDEVPVPSTPDFEAPRDTEIPNDNADKAVLHRFFCIADTLSSIDSNLVYSNIPSFEDYGMDENASGDNQAGYRHLMHQPTATHLQGGIAFYNHTYAITSEAVRCAKRITRDSHTGWHLPKLGRTEERRPMNASEVQRQRSAFLERLTSALLGHIPLIHAQPLCALVLDYAPWVRNIEAADGLLEVAAKRESEARALLLGGRTTRNSQRLKYERYLTFGDDQRQALKDTAFRVDDTLCGADPERNVREG